ASTTWGCGWGAGRSRPSGSRSPFPELRSALELRHEILETVVADAGAARHAGCDHHVTDHERRVADSRGKSRLAAFFDEFGGHDRDRIGKLLEDFGEDQSGVRHDLAVLAVERGLTLRVAIHEAPPAADSQIDLADRDRIAVTESSPPLRDVFGFRHRLEHEARWRIEQTRHADLL